jgi:hypothetical protein
MKGTYSQNKNSIYRYMKNNPEKMKQIRHKTYLKRKFRKNLLNELLKEIEKRSLGKINLL